MSHDSNDLPDSAVLVGLRPPAVSIIIPNYNRLQNLERA